MTDRSSRGESPRGEDVETLHGLLAPTEEEARAGIRGLRVEHEDWSEEQRRRRNKGRRNVLISAIAVFAVALFVVGAMIGPRLGLFEKKDYAGSGNGNAVEVTVAEGDSNQTIAQKLEQQGVVADADYFVETFEEKSDGSFIQPGTFELQEQMSSESALDALLGLGESATHYVAIAQGQRKGETFAKLAEGTGIPVSEFEALDEDPQQFGIPDSFPSLEGWLHPGEYRFATDITADQVIQQMVDLTRSDLDDLGVTSDEDVFHIVTVASILELEATPKDYRAVAGAIENRINEPMGETNGFIQSDATVTYGLGTKTYHVSDEEKADESNLYNTFAHKGLPVGPIDSPTKEAMAAAADPDDNDYFYWVTVNLETGETKFAETFAEHEQNVSEYQQWCADHEDQCQ